MASLPTSLRDLARPETWPRTSHGPGALLGIVKSVQGGEDDHSCTVELRESRIVLPHVPIAVSYTGFAASPRVGDLVLVMFVGDDLHAPVVLGCLYHQKLPPPDHASGEVVSQLPVDAQSDERIELRIKTPGDGTRKLTLLLDGDTRIAIDIADDGIRIGVGKAMLEMLQPGASDGSVTVGVGDAKLSMAQGGDVTLETTGKLVIKGQSIEISGDTTVKIAGQTIDLN